MSFTAKDCMSKSIKSVPPEMNAKDALKILVESGASGLPVIDKQGIPIGVFTEKEVLKAIMPVYLLKVGTFVYGEDSKAELKKLAHLEKFQVKDVMRKEVPTVTEGTSLTEVSHIMLTKSERRVIVVKDKKAIGVITRADVVKSLAKEAGVAL
jgi:CBS domain-containing protein